MQAAVATAAESIEDLVDGLPLKIIQCVETVCGRVQEVLRGLPATLQDAGVN